MGRDGDRVDLALFDKLRSCLAFRFIEQADLIRRQLFAAGGITPGQGQIELFLQGENLGGQPIIVIGY